MTFKMRFLGLFVLLLPLLLFAAQPAAPPGVLHGVVSDPSGAVVPAAELTLIGADQTLHTQSGADGSYRVAVSTPGTYVLTVSVKGFVPLRIDDVAITAGQTRELNLPLKIAVEQQNVTVPEQELGVGINPDQNSSAMILRGAALNAFSDDPGELRNELEALAGPAAGPSGGQIYIDGFAGGKLPPKSSILEIRVNQNPFSAEFDRLGYGRVEIFTKPGSQKFTGSLGGEGTASPLNTANPLVAEQPSYYQYSIVGNLSGPIGKNASYFLSAFRVSHQDQAVVDALNPQNPGTNFLTAFPTPITYLEINPRLDFELGQRNTLTLRDLFYRTYQTGFGVGTLNLPSQASNVLSEENQFQLGDTILVNAHFVNETHFQWARIDNDQLATNLAPTLITQGAFTSGGNTAGIARDRQNNFELDNTSTATAASHTLRFGARMRAYDDQSYSTSSANGTYTFNSVAAYQANTASQYAAAIISNPLARAVLFDGAFFLQDDWHWRPNFVLGLGLRLEGQNRIHNHADWAPRLALAWSPGRILAAGRPKTIVRAGYGWFYDRFTVPNFFSSDSGTPYILAAIHDNRINQQSYVVDNPAFYNPSTAEPSSVLESAGAVPTYHSIDPHFHAALDMQTGIGVDRQLTRHVTANVTYLYTQGVHQYLTNNVSAPAFDISTYTVIGLTPNAYNYQFQSGGIYRQNQLIVNANFQSKRLVVNGSYLLNKASSDTQGATYIPSVAQDPGFDYGRASFGNRHRMSLIDSYTGPYGIVVASLLYVRSGVPFNLTIGNDLTANNQFNARPAYGICGAAGVVSTKYGCLDTDPVGKNEKILPYGVGIGPMNAVFHLILTKVFGVGPRVASATEETTYDTGNSVSNRGLSGGGADIRLKQAAPRRYTLSFGMVATNLFNRVNLGPPNGVLLSPLFDQSQSLATGTYQNPTPGNRAIKFQSTFSF